MMYSADELQELTPVCEKVDEFGNCYIKGHFHHMYDSRTIISEECSVPSVSLSHSCGEWVIGGLEQIKMLIADLQAVLRKYERESI